MKESAKMLDILKRECEELSAQNVHTSLIWKIF